MSSTYEDSINQVKEVLTRCDDLFRQHPQVVHAWLSSTPWLHFRRMEVDALTSQDTRKIRHKAQRMHDILDFFQQSVER